jgi:hypothetical protein
VVDGIFYKTQKSEHQRRCVLSSNQKAEIYPQKNKIK